MQINNSVSMLTTQRAMSSAGKDMTEAMERLATGTKIENLENLKKEFPTVKILKFDISDHDKIEEFIENANSELKGLDVLVNNVGDYRPLVRFLDSSPSSWKEMYDINLHHIFLVTHAFLQSMVDNGGGSIINIHSVEGMRGYPGDPIYGAMKAAVGHFSTCLAAEFGRKGIRVNGMGVDLTQTPQVDYISGYEDVDHLWEAWAPVGRLGWPEDQARVALFLASDISAFVTGHNIPVDGGSHASGGWFFSPQAKRFVNRPKTL